VAAARRSSSLREVKSNFLVQILQSARLKRSMLVQVYRDGLEAQLLERERGCLLCCRRRLRRIHLLRISGFSFPFSGFTSVGFTARGLGFGV